MESQSKDSDKILDYRKIKIIGKTSTGTTHLAYNTVSHNYFALKEVNHFSSEIMKDLAGEQLIKNMHPQFIKSKVIVKTDGEFYELKSNLLEEEIRKGKQTNQKKKYFDNFILYEELSHLDNFNLYFISELAECSSIYYILESQFVLDDELIKNFAFQILCMLKEIHSKNIFLTYMDNKSVLVKSNGSLYFTNFYLRKDYLQEIRLSTSNKETSYFFLPVELLDFKKLSCFCHICTKVVDCECECCITKICEKMTEMFKADVYSLGMMLLEMVYGNFNLLSHEYLKEIDEIIFKSNHQCKEEEEYYPITQDVRIKDLKESFKEIAKKYRKGSICEGCKEVLSVKEEGSDDTNDKCINLSKEKEVMKEVTNTRKIKTKKRIPDGLLDVITMCLSEDYKKRPSVDDLLNHFYFKNVFNFKKESIDFYFKDGSNFLEKSECFFKKVNEKLMRDTN